MFNFFNNTSASEAPTKELAVALRQADHALQAALNREVKSLHLSLTEGENWALGLLIEKDGLIPTELARITGKDRPSISRITAALERKGLMKRKAHASDGRSSRLWLTDKGRARAKTMIEAELKVRTVAFHKLASSDIIIATKALSLLVANLNRGGSEG